MARANVAAAVAFYFQVVGLAPGTLRYPSITDLVPSSLGAFSLDDQREQTRPE